MTTVSLEFFVYLNLDLPMSINANWLPLYGIYFLVEKIYLQNYAELLLLTVMKEHINAGYYTIYFPYAPKLGYITGWHESKIFCHESRLLNLLCIFINFLCMLSFASMVCVLQNGCFHSGMDVLHDPILLIIIC